MKFFLAAMIAGVLAVMVPWYCSGNPGGIMGGLLDGRMLYFSSGGRSQGVHWSWLVFGVAFVLGYVAINAAEQKY